MPEECGKGMVSIVIVTWNTRDLVLDCIRSIRENTSDIPYEVIVVDNSSADGTSDAVRQRFPEVNTIDSGANLGFAGGNNLGARHAKGEYLLLLNPDTVVPRGAIRGMVDFLASHPEVSIVGPFLQGADGERQISSFGLFPGVAEAFVHAVHLWAILPKSKLAASFHQIPAEGQDWCFSAHLLGACMLMRTETWLELDGMDDGYFLFSEETDLCYRAALMGRRCAYTNDVRIIHYGEQSVQSILNHSGGLYIRSYNRFCRKFGMGPLKLALINIILTGGVILGCVANLVRRRGVRKSLHGLGALWYGYFRKPGVQERGNAA